MTIDHSDEVGFPYKGTKTKRTFIVEGCSRAAAKHRIREALKATARLAKKKASQR